MMYHSNIADNLKTQINNEMANLVNNTKLIMLTQYIASITSKEELESIKSELLLYNGYDISQQQILEKPKILVKMKEAGYVNTLILLLMVIFVLVMIISMSYILFKFGV